MNTRISKSAVTPRAALLVATCCLMMLPLFGQAAMAQETPVMPYDSLMDDRVSVDGYVEREDDEMEYPAQLKHSATGMTVSWGFDDNHVYVALETRGKGWFGIGFGAPGMDESNMVVGFYTDDSSEAYNLVGKGYSHDIAGTADSLLPDWDIDFDDETGVTCMEFTYPLKWRGEGAPPQMAGNAVLKATATDGFYPGDVYDVVLAQNSKSPSLAERHTHRSAFKIKLAENPRAESAEGEGD